MFKKRSLLLLVISLLSFLGLPLISNAQEKVTVYLFYGDGCPHCENAKTFFESLAKDDEYKDLFQLNALEIWKNKSNSTIADKAAVAMGDEALEGRVPYIVIGSKTWKGYSNKSNDALKEAIKNTYDDADFVDPLQDIVPMGSTSENSGNNVLPVVILIVAIALLGGTIYLARKE